MDEAPRDRYLPQRGGTTLRFRHGYSEISQVPKEVAGGIEGYQA